MGSEISAAKFPSGTISPPSTWPPRCSDTTSLIPSHLYNLTDQELDSVKKKLIELKPNIRKMWSTGGELTNLFQNHEVVIAMGWPLMTNQICKKRIFRSEKPFPKKTQRAGSIT